MNKLNAIVKEMLEKHTGGKDFFNNLDPALQDKEIVEELYYTLPHSTLIVVTGDFGVYFYEWLRKRRQTHVVVVLPGGIRDGRELRKEMVDASIVNGKEYVIVDDSYYSGRTASRIMNFMKSLGAVYLRTHVIYDGAFHRNPDVSSLYKYYHNNL